MSWYSRDDQYSRKIHRRPGNADFLVPGPGLPTSIPRVTISPDRRNIYITTSVGGEIYTVSDVRLTGDLVLEENHCGR